jgi:hypothetical protein
MRLYKILSADGKSCNGGNARWLLPKQNEDGTWTPGEWMPGIGGKLVRCKNGYHVVDLQHLPEWLNARIFEVEVDGEIINADDKHVCRKCRLVRELTAWNERTARLFMCDCAEHVLHIYEERCPNDDRPRKAIETARKFANGEATEKAMASARDAAMASARDPADSAVWAARAATWASARASAWAAARDPARAAVGAAADSAAWSAAMAAADSAEEAAEREWQEQRLRELLGEVE